MENPVHQEIAELENKLAEKRALLEKEKQSGNIESLPSNKELLHEVVGERIQQQAPSFTPAAPKPNSAQTPALSNPAVEDLMPKVQELVDTAFQKGLQEAIDEALKTSDFALLDIFHSALVGQLYDDLVERKIIAEP